MALVLANQIDTCAPTATKIWENADQCTHHHRKICCFALSLYPCAGACHLYLGKRVLTFVLVMSSCVVSSYLRRSNYRAIRNSRIRRKMTVSSVGVELFIVDHMFCVKTSRGEICIQTLNIFFSGSTGNKSVRNQASIWQPALGCVSTMLLTRQSFCNRISSSRCNLTRVALCCSNT